MSDRFDVAVVGGGIAGMAAAVALAEAGKRVALIERRPTLGGRVHSHADAKSGDIIDNGPHLLIGAYHHTRRLLRVLGTEGRVRFQSRLELVMRDARGEIALRRAPLPGDLALALGMARMRGVSWFDVWRTRRLLPAAREACAEPRRLAPLDAMTCAQWFDELGIPASVRRLMLDPICLAALNDTPERCSAALMARVLGRVFSGRARDSGLGFITGPHTGLFADALGPFLEKHGGALRLGATANRIAVTEDAADGVELSDGSRVGADHLIVAVAHHQVAALFDETTRGAQSVFDHLAALGAVPIVNVHLWLDRAVMDRPLVGLVDRPTQWVFALDHLWTEPRTPHRVVGVISGAHKAAAMDGDALAAQTLDDLRAVFPAAREAQVSRSVAIRERAATFSSAPGLLAKRPGAASPWRNVWWAGDWTATGLPSTLESAAQSGHAAAEAILRVTP